MQRVSQIQLLVIPSGLISAEKAFLFHFSHYNRPYVPAELLSRLDNFRGTVVHSGEYRYPEKYAGKNVLIIGGSSSAVDIARELSKFARTVRLKCLIRRTTAVKNERGLPSKNLCPDCYLPAMIFRPVFQVRPADC